MIEGILGFLLGAALCGNKKERYVSNIPETRTKAPGFPEMK